MNKDSEPSVESRTSLRPITAEEFDAMFDAGEDVSAYIDWDKGVMVAPDELSPGQLESLLSIFGKLSSTDKSILVQRMLDAVASIADENSHFSVAIPAPLHLKLRQAATKRRVTDGALLQSWIEQKLEEQEVTK